MIRNVEFKTQNDTIQFTTDNGTFSPPENGAPSLHLNGGLGKNLVACLAPTMSLR